METSKITDIIINVLQETLSGKIKGEENVNLNFIANAIVSKINFQKPSDLILKEAVVNSIKVYTESVKKEMNNELQKLDEEKEKLLRNFVKGQITACDKIEDFANKI